jgi:ribonuclease-3
MADIIKLQAALGIAFADSSLLEQALVHSSFVNENPDSGWESNERLEFLGDAILGLIIAEKLYQDFPKLAEGEMTSLRSVLVRKDTLNHVAWELDLGEYLRLGKGEESSGGRRKGANLARALEAVIAALFLDQGLSMTRKLVLRLFREELNKLTNQGKVIDFKSQLQEIIQSRYHTPPQYRVIEAEGPDHSKTFTVEVMGGGVVLGRGAGKSKKLAETDAARQALEELS